MNFVTENECMNVILSYCNVWIYEGLYFGKKKISEACCICIIHACTNEIPDHKYTDCTNVPSAIYSELYLEMCDEAIIRASCILGPKHEIHTDTAAGMGIL